MLKTIKRTVKLLFGKKYTDLVYEDYNRGNIYCDCKGNKKASQFHITKSVSYYDAMIYYCGYKNYTFKETDIDVFPVGSNKIQVTIYDATLKKDLKLDFEFSRNTYYTKRACLDCNKCVGWFNHSNRMIESPLYEMERFIASHLKTAKEKREKQELAEKICNIKDDSYDLI